MLRFSMYGQHLHECDMTSASATDLLRQYQNAVFSPIMRVHQMHGVPRFPYLWCDGARGDSSSTPEHCMAFRQALDMRYQFIPYVYSLAHIARDELRPIARPALFEFPGWTHPATDNQDVWGTWSTYMFGSHIVTADLGFRDGAAKQGVNSSSVALPPGTWFKLNSSSTVKGDAVITEDNLALAEFPVYVRPGAILTLNQEKVQWSNAQGGALEVQVYGGADGTFTLYEDDGATLDYKKGGAAVRKTKYSWSDASKTLSWKASGAPVSSNGEGAIKYTTLEVVYFVQGGAAARQRSASTTIGNTGSIKMA